jgi:hypothetical protein
MRPWKIVMWSAVLALVAAAAMVRPELGARPHAAMLPSLMLLLPTLALVALAVYALCAILLTSGDLVAEVLRVRLYLARNPARRGPDWTAVFAHSAYRGLMPRPAAVPPHAVPPDGTITLQGLFEPNRARREVARLYYIGAARAHFFSVLVVLAAAVMLGVAQARGALLLVPGPIPTVPAALAVAGLVLVAVLARIAVDVATEPLIEMISRLPIEPAASGWLRSIAERVADAPGTDPLPAATAPATIAQIPDRLGAVLEQGHLALVEAIERLSLTTDGLAQTTRSSIEALEAAFHASERHDQPTAQATRPDTAAMSDLRDALTALTSVLQRVRTAPAAEPNREGAAAFAGSREPDLALELRKLLQEIEATP